MAEQNAIVEQKVEEALLSKSTDSSTQYTEEILQMEIPCKCEDGEIVNARVALLMQCKTFQEKWKTVDTNEIDEFVFLAEEVSSRIFKKMVDWMENHIGIPQPVVEEDQTTCERKWFTLTEYEMAFFRVDVEEHLAMLVAALNVDLYSLFIFGCQQMAALIKDKTPEDIRDLLDLPDDLTEEEKEQIRIKNVWCNY